MIRFATFNVNSVKARLHILEQWFARDKPECIFLQEIKCQEENFPLSFFEDHGYQAVVFGQKSYNGVAILSRYPLEDVTKGFGGFVDEARYIEALLTTPKGAVVRCASLYIPNGTPIHTERYVKKIRWLEGLRKHIASLLKEREHLVLGGDYNVIPTKDDAAHIEKWEDGALFGSEVRRAFQALLNLGCHDAFRLLHPKNGEAINPYTFWDYQARSFHRNDGIRIDHMLLSSEAADTLQDVSILKDLRALEKASDHTPLVVTLDL